MTGAASGLPHLSAYLQRSETSHARSSAKPHPTQLDCWATRVGPGTSPPPSPKPALPALRDGSHRETLAHGACVILPPRVMAWVSHRRDGSSQTLPLLIPALPASLCELARREQRPPLVSKTCTKSAGRQGPPSPRGVGVPVAVQAHFRNRKSVLLTPHRGGGLEGLDSHHPPQEKVRPDPGLRACVYKPHLVFTDPRSTYKGGWAPEGPSSQTQTPLGHIKQMGIFLLLHFL